MQRANSILCSLRGRRGLPFQRRRLTLDALAEYAPPSAEGNDAYKAALSRIKLWKSEIPIESTLVLHCLDAKNHHAYKSLRSASDILSEGNDAARYFYFEEFQRKRRPFLLCDAVSMSIVGDLFPFEILPKVAVDLIFGSKVERRVFRGEFISPSDGLQSPRVLVARNILESVTPKKVSFVLVDLDYPDCESGSLTDCCHWLMANVPFTNYLDFASLPSPFIESGSLESSIGDVLYPYVPPHPSKANPKMNHRFAFVLVDQGTKTVDSTAYPSQKNELDLKARILPQKTWGLCRTLSSLPPAESILGYAFFRTTHDDRTSSIFERLGLHEPVYAQPPRNSDKFFSVVRGQKFVSFDKKPEIKTKVDVAISEAIESASVPLKQAVVHDKSSTPKSKSLMDTVKQVKSRPSDVAASKQSERELDYVKRRLRFRYKYH